MQFGFILYSGEFDFNVEARLCLSDVGLGLVQVQVFVVERLVRFVRHVWDRYVVKVVALLRVCVRHMGRWVWFDVRVRVEERHWNLLA